jgi:hypothetical protein
MVNYISSICCLIWLITTILAFLSMVEAMVVNIVPAFDRKRVPNLLREGYRWGLAAIGVVALVAMAFTLEFLIKKFPWDLGTYEQWVEHLDMTWIAPEYAPLVFAPVLPTGICWCWCWCWWRRRCGAAV